MPSVLPDRISSANPCVSFPGEVGVQVFGVRAELSAKPVPVLGVIAEIHEECCRSGVHHRPHVLDDRLEQVPLGPGSSHRQQEATRRTGCHALHPLVAVRLDVLHDLVVDMMADVVEGVARNRMQNPVLLVEAAHGPKPEVTGG